MKNYTRDEMTESLDRLYAECKRDATLHLVNLLEFPAHAKKVYDELHNEFSHSFTEEQKEIYSTIKNIIDENIKLDKSQLSRFVDSLKFQITIKF